MGLPTVFVRLTGCPLRCVYCDTEYAFSGGELLSMSDIAQQVAGFAPRYVTVTGGEPLAQPNCLPLLHTLCDAGYDVSLETGGAMSLAGVDPRVVTVLDLKDAGFRRDGAQRLRQYSRLLKPDQVKFVICDRADYEWARFKLDEYQLARRVADILFSPSFGSWRGASWPNGFWRIICRCACNCSCTSCCGMTSQGVETMSGRKKRGRIGLRRTGLHHGAGHGQAQGYACYTLSFDYGQRHRGELLAAERVSSALGDVEHKVVQPQPR